MNKEILEQQLFDLIMLRFTTGISEAIQLGKSVRTFPSWNDVEYIVKKGQKGFSVKVGDRTWHYYWWT